MVASVIKKVLKPLTKKIVDKLRKNPEDLTRAERKAVRDHQKSRGKTYIDKDGTKITKYPYMGEAGQIVAKRPKKSDPSPEAIEKFMKKEDAKDRALSAKRLREIRKEERSESLTGELGFKKGGRIVGRPISKLSTSKRRQFGRKLEGPPPRRQTESEKRRGVPTEEQLRRMKSRQQKRRQFGLKEGGKVKKCRMDGIALRGKTRAKERSK